MRQDRFAAELGMSRHSISVYERELRRIPPVVALACEALQLGIRRKSGMVATEPDGDISQSST